MNSIIVNKMEGGIDDEFQRFNAVPDLFGPGKPKELSKIPLPGKKALMVIR